MDFFRALECCERRLKLRGVASGVFAQSVRENRRSLLFRPDARQNPMHAKGELPSDYHANLGKGFDEKCVKLLRVNYDQLVERVKQGGRMRKFCNGASE